MRKSGTLFVAEPSSLKSRPNACSAVLNAVVYAYIKWGSYFLPNGGAHPSASQVRIRVEATPQSPGLVCTVYTCPEHCSSFKSLYVV